MASTPRPRGGVVDAARCPAGAAPHRPGRRRRHHRLPLHAGRVAAAFGPTPRWSRCRRASTPTRFRPDPGARAAVRAPATGSGDAPVVVCVSRLVPRKGQDVLVRALPRLRARVPGTRLLLVGGGPGRRDGCARLAACLRRRRLRCVLAGRRSPAAELPAHHAAGDVFALPCRTRGRGLDVEGLGIALLEAAACGPPGGGRALRGRARRPCGRGGPATSSTAATRAALVDALVGPARRPGPRRRHGRRRPGVDAADWGWDAWPPGSARCGPPDSVIAIRRVTRRCAGCSAAGTCAPTVAGGHRGRTRRDAAVAGRPVSRPRRSRRCRPRTVLATTARLTFRVGVISPPASVKSVDRMRNSRICSARDTALLASVDRLADLGAQLGVVDQVADAVAGGLAVALQPAGQRLGVDGDQRRR